MEDRTPAASSLPRTFRCPGHTQPIDRGLHLARLASFYPACLQCDDRHDTTGLTTLQIEARADVERRATRGCQWSSEGLEWTTGETSHPQLIERVVNALAARLWRMSATTRPTVLVGSDGGGSAADLVTLVCRTLQLSGCSVLECGAVSSPCLATAVLQQQAHGALWIGSAGGEPHAVSLRLWQEMGRPSSSPGTLDELRASAATSPARARRGGGAVGRLDAETIYLPALAGGFHGLRPLVIVLDSTCEPLLRYWQKLTLDSACRIIRPQQVISAHAPTASARSGEDGFAEQRTRAVARQVVLEGAHFGMWISGDGETCHLVNERGEPVTAERVLLLLAEYIGRGNEALPIALVADEAVERESRLKPLELRRCTAGIAREQIADEMEHSAAQLGSDGRGRYWYPGGGTPDALATLCLLLSLLSESDRPLSEVLDAGAAAK
jgi:hypothetical protein